MNREYHRWYSHHLGRDMELLAFGHAGQPVIVFPTSMGSFFEYEDRGMVHVLADRIESGSIRLYCVDSVDNESWYNDGLHPRQRVERHLQYEEYLLDEVLPLIRTQNGDRGVVPHGCSLGAFHAALFALRQPFVCSGMLALSGKYDNSGFLHGYSDEQTYLTNPLAFLGGLHDHERLEAMRRMNLVIVSGSTDPHIEEAQQLSTALWDRAVPNTLDVWDGWVHDWPYWEAMALRYL